MAQGAYPDEALDGAKPVFHYEKPNRAAPKDFKWAPIKDFFGNTRWVLQDASGPKGAPLAGTRDPAKGMTFLETAATGFSGQKLTEKAAKGAKFAGNVIGHGTQAGASAPLVRALGNLGGAIGPKSKLLGQALGSMAGAEATTAVYQMLGSDRFSFGAQPQGELNYIPMLNPPQQREWIDDSGNRQTEVKQELPGLITPMLAKLFEPEINPKDFAATARGIDKSGQPFNGVSYMPGAGRTYGETLSSQMAKAKLSPEYLEAQQKEKASASTAGETGTGTPAPLNDVEIKARDKAFKSAMGSIAIPSGGFDRKTLDSVRTNFGLGNSEYFNAVSTALAAEKGKTSPGLGSMARGVAEGTVDPATFWNEQAKFFPKGKGPDTIVFPAMIGGNTAKGIPSRMLVLTNEGGSVRAYRVAEGAKELEPIEYQAAR